MKVEELLKRIKEVQEKVWPQTDRSRSFTLTGSAIALPNESCKVVTLLNTTGANVVISINSGDNITIPSGLYPLIVKVSNTNLIRVNGTAANVLHYIISE